MNSGDTHARHSFVTSPTAIDQLQGGTHGGSDGDHGEERYSDSGRNRTRYCYWNRYSIEGGSTSRISLRGSSAGHLAVDGRVFDVGIQTSYAIRRLKEGVPAAEAGRNEEMANGNGSSMACCRSRCGTAAVTRR